MRPLPTSTGSSCWFFCCFYCCCCCFDCFCFYFCCCFHFCCCYFFCCCCFYFCCCFFSCLFDRLFFMYVFVFPWCLRMVFRCAVADCERCSSSLRPANFSCYSFRRWVYRIGGATKLSEQGPQTKFCVLFVLKLCRRIFFKKTNLRQKR